MSRWSFVILSFSKSVLFFLFCSSLSTPSPSLLPFVLSPLLFFLSLSFGGGRVQSVCCAFGSSTHRKGACTLTLALARTNRKQIAGSVKWKKIDYLYLVTEHTHARVRARARARSRGETKIDRGGLLRHRERVLPAE